MSGVRNRLDPSGSKKRRGSLNPNPNRVKHREKKGVLAREAEPKPNLDPNPIPNPKSDRSEKRRKENQIRKEKGKGKRPTSPLHHAATLSARGWVPRPGHSMAARSPTGERARRRGGWRRRRHRLASLGVVAGLREREGGEENGARV